MAGDRSLAFVIIGLIGSMIVWIGAPRVHGSHLVPAVNAYAAARRTPGAKNATRSPEAQLADQKSTAPPPDNSPLVPLD
jgi:hypothetical protein